MSPETIGQQVQSKKSDVWMFGIVVYEIATRRQPYADDDLSAISTRINLLFLSNLYSYVWRREIQLNANVSI